MIINSVQYKEMYSDALVSVCEYMKKQRDYETILELTSTAAEIYPFDEWQSLKIDALMSMNRYKEAYQFYEETSRMFYALGKDDESVQGNERQDEPEVSGGRRDQRRSEGTAA